MVTDAFFVWPQQMIDKFSSIIEWFTRPVVTVGDTTVSAFWVVFGGGLTIVLVAKLALSVVSS